MGQFMSTLAQRMYELSVPPHRAYAVHVHARTDFV